MPVKVKDANQLVVATDYKNAYRQDLYSWTSIDVSGLVSSFTEHGITAEVVQVADLFRFATDWEGRAVLYTGNEEQLYESFIRSAVYFLSERNLVMPSVDLLMCHNDKVFQENVKRRYRLGGPTAECFGSLEEAVAARDRLRFPAVFKLAHGSGSKNVSLVKNFNDLKRKILKHCRRPDYFRINAHKKLSRRKFATYRNHLDSESLHTRPFVLQEFIGGLGEDWKAIVFYDRVYVLNRKTRPNDFRASGSGRFAFETPPEEVLEFALECRRKLGTPFLQMDIGIKNRECYLFEFQACSFGPRTAMFAPHYFVKESTWKRVDTDPSLHGAFAYGVATYLRREVEVYA